jgi:acetyl-CoA C-acetyltransferase
VTYGAAIVGAVQTRYEAAKTHQTYNELVYEVVSALLDETGVSMAEIDSMVTASQDMYDGKTISGMSVNEVVGGYLKSEAKVAGDGIQALLYGVARTRAEAFDYTLVVAHCKESEGQAHPITATMFDPFCQRPLGFDELLAAAFEARRYMSQAGVTEEDLARVSRKNHRSARENPLALRSGDFSLEQILGSPVVIEPLRELLVRPTSDGACALLLARPEGNATDAYWTDRELADSSALRRAAARAYQEAGITQPEQQIDLAEISAPYAHQELLYAEALGLCGRKKPQETVAVGEANLDGPMPINPSGGPLPGNPATVAGLARLAEAYLQLAGEAGEHQVPGAGTALAHGAGGICGQSQTVVILRRERAAPGEEH